MATNDVPLLFFRSSEVNDTSDNPGRMLALVEHDCLLIW